jgi:Holliday junction DNA helicase RuvB
VKITRLSRNELAEEIAQRLDGKSQDVRDAVRIARLAPQLGVERAIKLLLGG